jgi:hypothetical protein
MNAKIRCTHQLLPLQWSLEAQIGHACHCQVPQRIQHSDDVAGDLAGSSGSRVFTNCSSRVALRAGEQTNEILLHSMLDLQRAESALDPQAVGCIDEEAPKA